MIQDMNTNRQLIEQFLQFINTGDATIGKPIISDDVIFYAPTSPEPMKGSESHSSPSGNLCVSVLGLSLFAVPYHLIVIDIRLRSHIIV